MAKRQLLHHSAFRSRLRSGLAPSALCCWHHDTRRRLPSRRSGFKSAALPV